MIRNPELPASPAQIRYLAKLTGNAPQSESMTMGEADKAIKAAMKDQGMAQDNGKAKAIFQEAYAAGNAAHEGCIPEPMVVQQHANMFDDNSPVVMQQVVNEGVCGHASIWLKCNTPRNTWFIKQLKREGLASAGRDNFACDGFTKDSYRGGFIYWVGTMTQSYERKRAFAHAFANVLKSHDITCYTFSDLD